MKKMVETMTPNGHFEINWPLLAHQQKEIALHQIHGFTLELPKRTNFHTPPNFFLEYFIFYASNIFNTFYYAK